MVKLHPFVRSGNRDGDIITLLFLRKAAKISFYLNLYAALLYLGASLIFPKSNTAALGCGTLAILISLTPVLYASHSKHFLVCFSCITSFNLAPIWFLYKDSVLPGTDTFIYSPPAFKMEAFFWIAMFQCFVNLFYVLFWRRLAHFSINSFSFIDTIELSPSFYHKLTFFTFTLPLILFYLYYGSFDTLWLAMTAGRTGGGSSGGLLIQKSVGESSSLMLPINSIWELTPLFGSMAFVSSKEKLRIFPSISLTLGLLVVFVFFLSGSRGTMMFVAAPLFFFVVYYNWHRGLKFWIPVALLVFVTVGIMEIQVRFRGNLLNVIANPTLAAKTAGFSSITTFDPTEAQHENNMYLFCLMIKAYPEKYSFQGFSNFFTTLVNPIPRAVWPSKPLLDGAKDLSYQPKYILNGPVYMGTTSLTYSVVGEAYIAGGFWGIVVYSLLYAVYLSCFDSVIYFTKEKQVIAIGVLGVSVFLAFWGFRALFALVTFLYPLGLFILFLRLIKIFNRSNK